MSFQRAQIALSSLLLCMACAEPPMQDSDAGARADVGLGMGDSGLDVADGATPSDAGPDRDGGTLGGDGAAASCGMGDVDFGGVARNCARPECFDDDLCTRQQLDAQGHVGFTECGTPQIIDPSSSNEACMRDPPFGGSKWARRCGELSYRGEVRFFCSAARDAVVARFSATLTPGAPGIYAHLGHDYWAGSGGGSGDSYSVSWPTDDFGERFVGYQSVSIPAGGSAHLDVWFFSGDLMSAMYVAGGFGADLPPE